MSQPWGTGNHHPTTTPQQQVLVFFTTTPLTSSKASFQVTLGTRSITVHGAGAC